MGVYNPEMKMPKGCVETSHGYACPYILYCKAYTRDKPSVDKRPKDCPLIEIPKGAEVAMTAEGLKMVYVPMEKEYGADDIDAD